MLRRMLIFCLLSGNTLAVSRPHEVIFGKWMTVQWLVGANETQTQNLKVRALFVAGRAKEFTIGPPHEVTDRLFVVRRAFRVNDALPGENATPLRWRWQRGGWLLVDRVTGRISAITLPDFDSYYSSGSWYRDYLAYCGVSEDGRKISALVVELGRRKPVLKQPLHDLPAGDLPDSGCSPPEWQRQPARVTFWQANGQKLTYNILGHAFDVVNDNYEEEGTE